MNGLIKFYYVDIDVWWISSWNIWLYRFICIYIFLKIFGFLYKWYVDFFFILYVIKYCMFIVWINMKWKLFVYMYNVFIYMLFLFIF